VQHQVNGVAELGAVEAPLLVFGGPYGNLEALRAVRAEARRLGLPAAQVICTGDLVAYCADAAAVVDEIRAWGIAVVMGNVEESLSSGAADCACGFTPGGACDGLAARWYAHCDAAIDGAARRWMAGLPRRIDLAIGGRRLAVVHGAPSRINRFVFASTPAAEKRAELALAGADGIVGGHCGLPFLDFPGDGAWCNAGAIGLPANDGTPRGWYALLAPRRDGLVFSLRAFDYDFGAAQRKMRAAGLPEAYAASLASGLWPPVDFLPPAELAATGRPLAAAEAAWRVRRAAA
jgi:predicted phosphodiesterase